MKNIQEIQFIFLLNKLTRLIITKQPYKSPYPITQTCTNGIVTLWMGDIVDMVSIHRINTYTFYIFTMMRLCLYSIKTKTKNTQNSI